MKYAAMPIEHWEGILDSVRAKTGKSSWLVSGQVAEEIDGITGTNVPTYHYAEAARVIEKITAWKKEHPNNLVFGAVSDIHVFANDAQYGPLSKKAIRHAAFALETVGAMAGVDFVVNLGDNCWENGIDTENAFAGAEDSIGALSSAFSRLTSYSLVGNHDKSDDTLKQFNLIGSKNSFDGWGYTKIRGFGYKDFDDKKVRVIVLNTTDYLNASGGCAMSYDQKDFLMRALDLSDKQDFSKWQILLLSHIPLDWQGGDYYFYDNVCGIIHAYEAGATVAFDVIPAYALNETPSNYATYHSGSLKYSYKGKNYAKIIANIHGHVHTNKVGRVSYSYIHETNTMRVATVNTNPSLNKSESYPDYGDYSITTEEAAKLVKVQGTAKDTAATFYCIDLDEKVIYAFGYGADVDRVIAYPAVKTFAVEYSLEHCVSSNVSLDVEDGSEFTTVISATDDGTITSVIVTMDGVDVTSQYYDSATHTVLIPAVTGNIAITAVAKIPAWNETLTNIAVATRSVWAISGGKPSLASSNTEAAIGVTTANNFAYTDRESNTVYLMPVNAKASDIVVENADGHPCTYRFVGLKYNGSTFETIFDSAKIAANTYAFSAKTIDYILVSMERSDGTSFEWGYNDAQVTVKFTNGVADDPGEEPGEDPEDKPTYTNVIDEVGTIDNVRLRSGGATGGADGFASNYFSAKGGDVIRVWFPNGDRAKIPSNGVYCCTYSDTNGTLVTAYDGSTSGIVLKNVTDTGYEIHIPADVNCSYARVAGGPAGAYAGWVVTVNEQIE